MKSEKSASQSPVQSAAESGLEPELREAHLPPLRLPGGDGEDCREHAPRFFADAVAAEKIGQVDRGREVRALESEDLPEQKLTLPSGKSVEFAVDEFSKHCLVNGVDELGYIQHNEAAIAAFEARREGSINTLA